MTTVSFHPLPPSSLSALLVVSSRCHAVTVPSEKAQANTSSDGVASESDVVLVARASTRDIAVMMRSPAAGSRLGLGAVPVRSVVWTRGTPLIPPPSQLPAPWKVARLRIECDG